MTVTVTYDYDSFRSDLRKKMHRLGNFQKSSKGGGGSFIFNPKINTDT